MVSSISAGYDILILILLVVPGYLGIKYYISITGIHDTYNRLEYIVYSLLLSLCSITLLYSLLSLLFAWPTLRTLLNLSGYATVENIQGIPLVGFILLYIFHSLLTLSLSKGYALYKQSDLSDEIQPPMPYDKAWDLESADEIRIKTRSDNEIIGRKLSYGDYERGRGVLVLSPERIYRNGGDEVNRIDDGQHLYIHEDAVSQIEFFEPEEFDPDRERGEEAHESKKSTDGTHDQLIDRIGDSNQ